MLGWNQAVVQACQRYPKMRVYDWASEVQNDWFASDGIHFNTPGYKERAVRIAKALAHAFPKDASSPADCLVHGTD
jgi:lysophospholipase L1-like esterase